MNDHPLLERARTSRVPVAALIGFSIEPLGDGQAAGWLEAGPQHANPMGTLHGGILDVHRLTGRPNKGALTSSRLSLFNLAWITSRPLLERQFLQ